MKRVIITGDDFGLAIPVNEAIVEAHVGGILTTASLMVGAEAADDAVDRARGAPSLRLGLHIVLVEGRPVLPPAQIPDLVDERGEFGSHLVKAGFSFFLQRGVRKQLEWEVRAQFEAFSKTGFPLDHVNAHNHMHLHPTVLNTILKVGRQFGMRALRVPREPILRSWRASHRSLAGKAAWSLFLLPWLVMLRARLRREGLRYNDYVFGMSDSGAMRAPLVQALVPQVPEGVTELYFHPSVRRCPALDRTMPDYDHEGEFQALISPAVRAALERAGLVRITFSDL